MIKLSQIRTDGGTQSRAAIREETVAEYAEAMENPQTVFPPIVLYYDGTDHWLADGFHRLAAWKRIRRVEVPADVRQGDRRRAILHSVAANAAHGLRRSNEDKRRAVMTLLEDDEWAKWSDREIARKCGVSNRFVSNLRDDVSVNRSQMRPKRTVTRGGTTFHQDTSQIGKRKAPKQAQAHQQRDVGQPEDHDPAPAEKPDAAAQPRPEHTPDPYGYAKLSEDALIETANGLRAECEEQRQQVNSLKNEINRLTTRIEELTSNEDAGRKIGNLQRQLAQAEGRANEHQAKAARLQGRVNAQKAEIQSLKKSLEIQVIRL